MEGQWAPNWGFYLVSQLKFRKKDLSVRWKESLRGNHSAKCLAILMAHQAAQCLVTWTALRSGLETGHQLVRNSAFSKVLPFVQVCKENRTAP